MVGHKWVKAMAAVVSVRGLPGDPQPQGPEPVFSITQALREYVVEVCDPKGQVLRAALAHNSRFVYPVGSALPVEVNFKSGEVKLDTHAMAQRAQQKLRDRRSAAAGMTGGMVNVADQIQAQAADLAASGAMGGGAFAASPGIGAGIGGISADGALAGGIADAVSHALGSAGIDAGVHVYDSGAGTELHLGAERQAELQQLAQAMMSGDPAARQAAAQRLHEIRTQRLAELTGQQATAGPGAHQATAGPGAQQTTACTGGQQFPVGTPAGYGAQGAAPWPGSAQGAVRPASAEQRLASLEQLHNRGLLTDAEYQAKRQQIINEI